MTEPLSIILFVISLIAYLAVGIIVIAWSDHNSGPIAKPDDTLQSFARFCWVLTWPFFLCLLCFGELIEWYGTLDYRLKIFFQGIRNGKRTTNKPNSERH